jgi:hypothetical protein
MVSHLENENAKILKWQDNTPNWTNRWISVKDKTPIKGQEILFFGEDCGISYGLYLGTGFSSHRFIRHDKSSFNATHWMPLPSSPESKE